MDQTQVHSSDKLDGRYNRPGSKLTCLCVWAFHRKLGELNGARSGYSIICMEQRVINLLVEYEAMANGSPIAGSVGRQAV